MHAQYDKAINWVAFYVDVEIVWCLTDGHHKIQTFSWNQKPNSSTLNLCLIKVIQEQTS